MKNFLILTNLLFLPFFTFSQSNISGKIVDKESKEPLIGASVLIKETLAGSTSDFDGNFIIENVKSGNYTIVCSYIGYKEISTTITVSESKNSTFDFQMDLDTKVLEGVMIVGKADRQSVSALSMLQQKNSSMLSGISNEDFKKSPDRTSSDILKRVSGTSIQDNKFVIIRGLADRYNTSQLNGQALPSTEPDKRAFSFDLFPSNIISNLIIYKTATPDLPGEFAGGIISVNTKEVPEEDFIQLTLGASINSVSTFKNYQFYTTGKTDWLGYDNSTRALLVGITKAGLNSTQKYDVSKLMPNDWKINNFNSFAPSSNYQLSGGKNMKVYGKDFGMIGSLSYSNTRRIINVNRGDFNIDTSRLYNFNDVQTKNNVQIGGMLNFAMKLNDNNKLVFNNLMSIQGEDQFISRNGRDLEQERINQSYSMLYNSTKLWNSQLLGDHALNANGLKLKWGLTISDIQKNTPSYRRMTYFKNLDAETIDPFIAYIPIGAPSPNYAGRFYSNQHEKMYTANVEVSIPYKIFNLESKLKIGTFGEIKNRNFDARVFGYTRSIKYDYTQNLELLPIDQLLAPENINEKGFVLKESTNPNDSYSAGSELSGGFIMVEQHLMKKLKLVGGVRLEHFVQKLSTSSYGGTKIDFSKEITDFLPSANLIYALNDQSNLRASLSQTVCRPNFRELAPFSFYDFNVSASIVGDPNLVRTKITNFDLRYELFLTNNQSFSITGFYKKFNNPIEQFYETLGAGTRNFNFKNATTATNLGSEIEYRVNLGIIHELFKNFSFYGNLSYIYSKVDVSVDASSALNGANRQLQGQSPYLINSGLNYTNTKNGFSTTLLFNKIGRRIWLVGSNKYLDTYEAPRNVLDFQVAKKLFKNGEIKLNIQDILNNNSIFYQDQNNTKKFDTGDTKIIDQKFGTNYSLSFSYKF